MNSKMLYPKPQKPPKSLDTSGFAFPKPNRSKSKLTIGKSRKPLCEVCGSPAHGEPHHIIPRSLGGPDNKLNLIQLCHRCHYVEVAQGRLTKEQLFPIVAKREGKSEEEIRRALAVMIGREYV